MSRMKRPINTVSEGRLLAEKTNCWVVIWERLLNGDSRPVIVHLEELSPLVAALTDIMEICTPNELDPKLGDT